VSFALQLKAFCDAFHAQTPPPPLTPCFEIPDAEIAAVPCEDVKNVNFVADLSSARRADHFFRAALDQLCCDVNVFWWDVHMAPLNAAQIRNHAVLVRTSVEELERVCSYLVQRWQVLSVTNNLSDAQSPCIRLNVGLASCAGVKFELVLFLRNHWKVLTICHRVHASPVPVCPVCGLFQRFLAIGEITHNENLQIAWWENQYFDYFPIHFRGKGEEQIRQVGRFTRLQHKQLINIVALVKTDHGLMVLRERPGESLDQFLKNEDMPLASGLRVARHVAKALEFLHRENHPHGEFRVEHVNVQTNPMRAKLLLPLRFEMGAQPATATSDPLGNWKAPELWETCTTTKFACLDVYGFGCLLITLFAGAEPWRGTPRAGIGRLVLSGRQPPELDQIANATLKSLATRCLALEPFDRPTMPEIREQLRAVCVESPCVLCLGSS
jgi:hypothetical protein